MQKTIELDTNRIIKLAFWTSNFNQLCKSRLGLRIKLINKINPVTPNDRKAPRETVKIKKIIYINPINKCHHKSLFL